MQVGKILGGHAGSGTKKMTSRLAALALGTGLVLSNGFAKAQVTSNNMTDSFEPVETTQNNDKNSLGGLIFGGTLLAWMGAVALGNKLHDRKQQ